jgi:predicted lipoprotein with Yx(FWY)xxD motif
MNRLLTAALVATIAAPGAFGQAVSEKDGRLADAGGRTLYIFDKDSANASHCTGDCAVTWPPFVAPAGAAAQGDFGLVSRDGGVQQWSHKGRPLYYFAGDGKPGDANGEGRGGVWHTVGMGAKPAAPSGYDTIRGNY